MARIETVSFDITAMAESKFWSHGVDRQQVEAVLDRRWIVIRNRAGRAASYVVIGRDEQGRCIAIPIVPPHNRLV